MPSRYAFEYPAGWKVETVGKVSIASYSTQFAVQTAVSSLQAYYLMRGSCCPVQNEKGMQGIDSRVRNVKNKGTHVSYFL